jgi:hypothetical protein
VIDDSRLDALKRSICARICDGRRSIDELLVFDDFLGRLELGADRYGPLTLATDARDWNQELAEELADVLVYRSITRVLDRKKRVEAIEHEDVDLGGEA